MSFGSQNPWSAGNAATTRADYDLGLRQYMLRVYNYMASGLALTGVVAYFAFATGVAEQLIHGPMMWVVAFAPVILVFILAARINTMSLAAAQATFWAYAALVGLSLSTIFLRYTGASIAETFFVTAGTFLGMSLYGYTTKADLTKMGSFLAMGVIGLVIASLANLIFPSPGLHFVISVAGVLIFTGLTAWDTQSIKEQYSVGYGDLAARTALMGALRLYLDFINLFVFMLQFFGQRRN